MPWTALESSGSRKDHSSDNALPEGAYENPRYWNTGSRFPDRGWDWRYSYSHNIAAPPQRSPWDVPSFQCCISGTSVLPFKPCNCLRLSRLQAHYKPSNDLKVFLGYQKFILPRLCLRYRGSVQYSFLTSDQRSLHWRNPQMSHIRHSQHPFMP